MAVQIAAIGVVEAKADAAAGTGVTATAAGAGRRVVMVTDGVDRRAAAAFAGVAAKVYRVSDEAAVIAGPDVPEPVAAKGAGAVVGQDTATAAGVGGPHVVFAAAAAGRGSTSTCRRSSVIQAFMMTASSSGAVGGGPVAAFGVGAITVASIIDVKRRWSA